MHRLLVIMAGAIVLVSVAWTQSYPIRGRIVRERNSAPLGGVHVRLLSRPDSTQLSVTETDTAGRFTISDIRGGSYLLEATYLGYAKIAVPVVNTVKAIDLGTLKMEEAPIPLKEVVVQGRVPPAVQKGDTTEYTAQAFKMNKDATAEDLVAKMPGVTVQNGTVTAQGENVQQVLIDGRPFFGSDPTLSLRSLPSEIIDKVQVFDKLSDQGQLTGFDDGQTIKTMNIVTRADRRQGDFGRFNGGYGTDDRYIGSGSLSFFQGNQRISILGLSNNVNQQNFSTQDLFGVMSGGNQRGGFGGGGMPGPGRRSGFGGGGRGGGGNFGPGGASNNFLIGQQTGVSTTNSLGLNYADSIGGAMSLTGSYFFNLADNNNPQKLSRQYLVAADSSTFYGEEDATERRNYNHRVNLRMEYSPDSSNSFIFTPQIYSQDNHTTSDVLDTSTTAAGAVLSQSHNSNLTTTNGYTSQNHLVYRHRFATRGRTVSVDVGLSGNDKSVANSLTSFDAYFNGRTSLFDTIDQRSTVASNGFTLSSNIVYTEPVFANSLLQINFSPSYSKNSSDNRTYNFDDVSGGYSILNSQLSNTFQNIYVTNAAGIGYRLRGASYNVAAGVSYQIARLRNEQTFPSSFTLGRSFYSLLPYFMFNYEFSGRRNLRVFYRTSTTAPTVAQLQNIVDNTNPLLLSTGNPELQQSLSNTLLTRLTLSNSEKAQSMLLFLFVSYTHASITNATVSAGRDTVVNGGIHLLQGTQLTYPVNVNGNWNIRSLFTYGLPFDLLESNLNLNMGMNYTRTPGFVNGARNTANVYALSPGVVLGSNISEDLDFTISYTANFNVARNSVQTASNNDYFTHTGGLRLNWITWQGIVLKSDINNVLTHGLTGTLNQNYVLWNFSLGKKLLSDQRGELSVTVYDVLNQNKSINRTVTDTYVEDATSLVLQRYVMATFTYNLRQFSEQPPRERPPREFER